MLAEETVEKKTVCTKEFDWESHYDKYQLKLRKLIFDKIPK